KVGRWFQRQHQYGIGVTRKGRGRYNSATTLTCGGHDVRRGCELLATSFCRRVSAFALVTPSASFRSHEQSAGRHHWDGQYRQTPRRILARWKGFAL